MAVSRRLRWVGLGLFCLVLTGDGPASEAASAGGSVAGMEAEQLPPVGGALGQLPPTRQVDPRDGGDARPPRIPKASIKPQQLPHAGGSVDVSARVRPLDGTEIESVEAVTDLPGIGVISTELTFLGDRAYEGVLVVPQNPSVEPIPPTDVLVIATTTTGEVTEQRAGRLRVNAPEPPKISKANVKPKRLPRAGGTVELSARFSARSAGDVATVEAFADMPGVGLISTPLSLAENGRDWEALLDLPANPSIDQIQFDMMIRAFNTQGQSDVRRAGRVRLDGLNLRPPNIPKTNATPRRLPRSGGDVLVTADVRRRGDPEIEAVEVHAEVPGVGILVVPLSFAGGEQYSGILSLPANTEPQNMRVPLTVVARTDVGQEVSRRAGQVVIERLNLNVGNANVNPGNLPSGGGTVNVSVRVDTNEALASVEVFAQPPGVAPQNAPRGALNPSGRNYVGSVHVPPSFSPANVQVDIYVEVRTTAGDVVVRRIGRVTQQAFVFDPDLPPPPPID